MYIYFWKSQSAFFRREVKRNLDAYSLTQIVSSTKSFKKFSLFITSSTSVSIFKMAPVSTSDIANGVDNDARSTIFSKKGADVKSMAVGVQIRNGKSTVPTIPEFETLEEKQKWSKEHLVAAFRVFAERGYDEGVAGHMSLRDAIHPNRF